MILLECLGDFIINKVSAYVLQIKKPFIVSQ